MKGEREGWREGEREEWEGESDGVMGDREVRRGNERKREK